MTLRAYVAHPIPELKSSIEIDPSRVSHVSGSYVVYRGGRRVRTGASENELRRILAAWRPDPTPFPR